MALDEIFDEHQNVILALPKRWDFDGKDIQPIVQVHAKSASGNGRFQVAVGATLAALASAACSAAEAPIISSNIDALSISSRRATFSCCSLSSALLRSSMSVAATYQRTICPYSSRTGLQRARNHR